MWKEGKEEEDMKKGRMVEVNRKREDTDENCGQMVKEGRRDTRSE